MNQKPVVRVRKDKTDRHIARIGTFIREQLEHGHTCNVTLSIEIKSGGIARVKKTVADDLL